MELGARYIFAVVAVSYLHPFVAERQPAALRRVCASLGDFDLKVPPVAPIRNVESSPRKEVIACEFRWRCVLN